MSHLLRARLLYCSLVTYCSPLFGAIFTTKKLLPWQELLVKFNYLGKKLPTIEQKRKHRRTQPQSKMMGNYCSIFHWIYFIDEKASNGGSTESQVNNRMWFVSRIYFPLSNAPLANAKGCFLFPLHESLARGRVIQWRRSRKRFRICVMASLNTRYVWCIIWVILSIQESSSFICPILAIEAWDFKA